MARRDIFVVDVEVFEIAKKTISFKETKGGCVIKGKKFLLDSDMKLTFTEEQEVVPLCIAQEYSQSEEPVLRPAPKAQHQVGRPLFNAFFDPGKEVATARKEARLTIGRSYQVYKEVFNSLGIRTKLVIRDDNGELKEVNEFYFLPDSVSIVGFEEEDGIGKSKGDGLSWGGVVEENIPDLRR